LEDILLYVSSILCIIVFLLKLLEFVGMRVFFFLGQTFFEQSIAIAKEIKSVIPGADFRAIVAARSNIIDELNKIDDPRFSGYDWLSGLEKQWISTPLDKNKLKEYEEKLGSKVLRQIITADREIGVGFVSCGKVERTDLINFTKNDDIRWRYVIGLLDYLFTQYSEHRPDCVFAYAVAGAVAFAMGVVCEYLKIPFCQPVMGRVKQYAIMDNNHHWTLDPVKTLFNKAINEPDLIKEKLPEAKNFITQFRSKPVFPEGMQILTTNVRNKSSFRGIVKTVVIDIARCVAILLGLKGTKNVLRQRKGADILKNNLSIYWSLRKILNGKMKEFSNDLGDKEYLYYALHVDPEASTMVVADMFTDQMAVIESIAKSMPASMQLIVKEHIPCLGKRPKGFYERINSMPDVKLVSPFMDNFELIKNSRLVCTITGTAGWESILLGKPPVVIGNVHYLAIAEGLVHCHDLSKMSEAIKEAMTMQPVRDEVLINYIASIMTLGVEMSAADMWFKEVADVDGRKKTVKKIAEHLILIANVGIGRQNEKAV
jgi:hypothetical protein